MAIASRTTCLRTGARPAASRFGSIAKSANRSLRSNVSKPNRATSFVTRNFSATTTTAKRLAKPRSMRQLVELTGLASRKQLRKDGGVMGWLAPHLEAVVVSQRTYDLASDTMPRVLKQGAEFARSILGDENQPVKKLHAGIVQLKDTMDLARDMVEIYQPYIQQLVYTFHGKNTRDLYAAMRPADVDHHPYRPDLIDWHDY